MGTTQTHPPDFNCTGPLCGFQPGGKFLGPYEPPKLPTIDILTWYSFSDNSRYFTNFYRMLQDLINKKNGTNNFEVSKYKSDLQTQPISTLAAGIRLAADLSDEYGEFSRYLLNKIASLSDVPTLFEEDSTLLTEQQATKLVETLASVREELSQEPFVALSVLRGQERGGSQFTCFRNFGGVYFDKFRLEYGFYHCGKCGNYGSHRGVSILEGQRRIGLFCQDCYFPGNPNENQPGLFVVNSRTVTG